MRVRLAALFVAVVLVCSSLALGQTSGGTVSGKITDGSGQAIAGATVSIVELNRAAISDPGGAFQLGSVRSGRYTITARRLGYTPAATTVTVASSASTVNLTLQVGASRLEPFDVTSERAPTLSSANPIATSVLTSDQIARDGDVSLAHSVEKLPGVRDVSTGQQIGKPMIRGLFGSRVLVLSDGSRLEDYSWSDEDGPSIDARLAQRIEVIRGPASVLYGSDALSGVVNVVPADVLFSSDGAKLRREAAEAYGGSNNIELGGALMAEGSQGNRGWRIAGTGRFSQNYQTPNGSMPNSSFWAFNGEAAYGIRSDNGGTTFRIGHYGGEFHLLEATGPEVDDPSGGPVRQIDDDRVQMTNERLFHGFRVETKAQVQHHALAEVSDDCVPAPGETTCVKVKDKQAFGLTLNSGTVDVLAHHASGDHLTETFGVSGLYQRSTSTGPIFIVPSATSSSGAAFTMEQLTMGMLTVSAGARAESRHLSSDAQPLIEHTADSHSWSATSGSAGLVLQATHALALVGNFGTGWRAPTLFDLYANGPNLAEAQFEIGDPNLKTERSNNIEGGARLTTDRLRADVTVYQNTIDNYIFVTPTLEVMDNLQVFRHEQLDARLTGAEASLEARVTDRVSLRASHDFVNGEERPSDTPLPLIPPPRTILGAGLAMGQVGAFRHVGLDGDVEINQKQTRLNQNDFQTAGYSLVGLELTADHSVHARDMRFTLSVRNALNTSYQDYMSRFKTFSSAPGINVILKASMGAW